MKLTHGIFLSTLIICTIQVCLNLNTSELSENYANYPDILPTINTPATLWIEDPSVDNPGEIKNHCVTFSHGQPFVKKLNKNSQFRLPQHFRLDPLFLDRPPPLSNFRF